MARTKEVLPEKETQGHIPHPGDLPVVDRFSAKSQKWGAMILAHAAVGRNSRSAAGAESVVRSVAPLPTSPRDASFFRVVGLNAFILDRVAGFLFDVAVVGRVPGEGFPGVSPGPMNCSRGYCF